MASTDRRTVTDKISQAVLLIYGILTLTPGLGSASSPIPGISVSRTKLDTELEDALFSAGTDSDITVLQEIARQHGYFIEVIA